MWRAFLWRSSSMLMGSRGSRPSRSLSSSTSSYRRLICSSQRLMHCAYSSTSLTNVSNVPQYHTIANSHTAAVTRVNLTMHADFVLQLNTQGQSAAKDNIINQWRTKGGEGVRTPPLAIPKFFCSTAVTITLCKKIKYVLLVPSLHKLSVNPNTVAGKAIWCI